MLFYGMNFIKHKFEELRVQYNIKLNIVLLVGAAVLTFSVFDSIMSYLVPVIMTEYGLSEFNMGLLYSSSSFFGLLFDFILAKTLKTTNYKRMLTSALIVAILFPVCMFLNPGVLPFLLGMFLWGLYYNLWAFANADFPARESKVKFHVASVALLLFFHDIGYIIGTISAEPLLENFNYTSIMFILIGLIVLTILILIPALKSRSRKLEPEEKRAVKTTASESKKLFLVTRKLFPLLLLGVIATSIDAVIWTITPIIETILPQLADLGGVILAVIFLPSFFAYGIAAKLAARFGKKRVGIVSFICGALVLSLLGFSTTVFVYLTVSFVSSFFVSVSYAALGGAYADFLNESSSYDNEIIGTRDMATNLGYIIGPAIGGALLYFVNSPILFTYLGITAAILGLIIFTVTPKHIPFRDKNIE